MRLSGLKTKTACRPLTRKLQRRLVRRLGAKRARRMIRKRKCSVVTTVGHLTRSGHAGANQTPFSGRLATKALSPGTYSAVVVAGDAAGNVSTPQSTGFKVLRPKHHRRRRG